MRGTSFKPPSPIFIVETIDLTDPGLDLKTEKQRANNTDVAEGSPPEGVAEIGVCGYQRDTKQAEKTQGTKPSITLPIGFSFFRCAQRRV